MNLSAKILQFFTIINLKLLVLKFHWKLKIIENHCNQEGLHSIFSSVIPDIWICAGTRWLEPVDLFMLVIAIFLLNVFSIIYIK
jgi:hypothetical protein